MSHFVISLDFELFWGVADSRSLSGYGRHIEGEWLAIPQMLAMFRRYGIKATWATVGMLMCRDYGQWREIRPSIMPGYVRVQCSTYLLDELARQHPKLFFARPLVAQILDTPGQELASHTYSHFYCSEEGATPAQLSADLACGEHVGAELGVRFRSIVFPRNQVRAEFIPVLAKHGIHSYRGNPEHWLYRKGHHTPGGYLGRAIRFADSWLPLTGSHTGRASSDGMLTNVPASLFLRPWGRRLSPLEGVRLARLKRSMTDAARNGRLCHLWWHPHNFGVSVEENLNVLESLLRHYVLLRDKYGMRSATMADFIPDNIA